jgi:hypothetical protein
MLRLCRRRGRHHVVPRRCNRWQGRTAARWVSSSHCGIADLACCNPSFQAAHCFCDRNRLSG